MSGVVTPGGRGMLAARGAWMVVVLMTILVLVASVPVLYERVGSACFEAVRVCVERSEVPAGSVGALREAGLSLRAYAVLAVGVEVLCKLIWLSVGVLVFVFRSRDRMALLVSFFLVSFGTATLLTNGTEALASAHPAWWVVARSLQVTGEVSVVLFLLTFPDGRFVPRWTPIIAVVFLLFQIPGDLFPELYASGPGILNTTQTVVFVVSVLAMLALQVYRYRYVSGTEQRRQTRWAVFGTTLTILILILAFGGLSLFFPATPQRSPLVPLLATNLMPFIMVLIPLSIGVAIFRSGLFDIDLVINRALVYGTLTAMLVAVYFATVVVSQYVLRALTGGETQVAVVASTLAIAALFNPLRRRLQVVIDRLFYRQRYDARKTLEEFGATLRDETGLEDLTGELAGVVRDTVRPAHVSIWLKGQISQQKGKTNV